MDHITGIESTDPSRISAEDIRILISEIKVVGDAGEESSADGEERWGDYREEEFSAEDIRNRIAYEQGLIDHQLVGDGQRYVITARGTRRVHLPSCHNVRHVIHRDEAWRYVTAVPAPAPVSFRELGTVYAMPHILTREQVEALNSYVTCQACAPTLNHQQKLWVLNTRPMKATSIGLHHIGREVGAEDGTPLGTLISHQRIVTAMGIRSITTTTEMVIEGDGTEKYYIAPLSHPVSDSIPYTD